MRRLLIAAALTTMACSSALAQQPIDYAKLEIRTTDLGHGVYLLNWQGGDSMFLVGDDGVLLVDTSVAQMGDKIKAAIARVSAEADQARHQHPRACRPLRRQRDDGPGGAVIIGHDALRERMERAVSGGFNQTIPPSPPAALPAVTYADAMTIHFGGETVELIHVPRAHTDNDTLVRFKRANVIHASGTIGGNGGYPFFDMSSGGSLAGTIAAEEKMLSLSDEKTRIVADEGDPASTADLKASRDSSVTIRPRPEARRRGQE